MNLIIIFTSLVFDGLALVPFIGVLTNPIFGFILQRTYGVNSSMSSGINFKIIASTFAGTFLNFLGDLSVLFFWLPTNFGQAVYVIIIKYLNPKK